jgi:hypothetical protein
MGEVPSAMGGELKISQGSASWRIRCPYIPELMDATQPF